MPIQLNVQIAIDLERNWKRIQDLFLIRGENELFELLRQNSEMIPVIFAARELCDKYFPAAATPILEIMSDPEALEIKDSLFVVLRTSLDVSKAMERLYTLESEWLSSQIEGRSLLTFDLEFV